MDNYGIGHTALLIGPARAEVLGRPSFSTAGSEFTATKNAYDSPTSRRFMYLRAASQNARLVQHHDVLNMVGGALDHRT
jgi:hypothetical protein